MSWGAVIVGGSALIGGALSSKAASKAGKASQQAADASIEEQRRQFDLLRSDQAPYRELGNTAIGDINALRGGDLSKFYSSPDYKFNLEQGQQAIDRSLIARSGALSGAAIKEGQRFASGLASGQFSDYYNRLASQAGIGQTSTSLTGQAGMNLAGNVSSILQNNAQARGSAYMAGAAGVNGAVQGGASNLLLMNYLRPQSGGLYGDSATLGYQRQPGWYGGNLPGAR